jgi:potassium voltage-gated channel Eag-related subfamily H protein 8
MTSGLLISRKTKDQLYINQVNNPSIENLNKYKTYRNTFNSILRASKKLYFTSSLKKSEKNPKKTWDILKEAMNKQNQRSKIDSIICDNKQTNDPTEIAETFNEFFNTIGTSISESINPTVSEPDDFIPPNQNPPDLEFGPISPAVICNVTKQFESKNSTDIEGISMKLLKQIIQGISVPLSHIFNLSLQSGIFPDKLKISRTVPVFKSGNPASCDNYRPISLLPSVSKILEKLVAIQLTNHIELNNLLYKHQYGFQKGKSTEHNLIHLTNTIYNALNDKNFV